MYNNLKKDKRRTQLCPDPEEDQEAEALAAAHAAEASAEDTAEASAEDISEDTTDPRSTITITAVGITDTITAQAVASADFSVC